MKRRFAFAALFQLLSHAFHLALSRTGEKSVVIVILGWPSPRRYRHPGLDVFQGRLHRRQDVPALVPVKLTPTGRKHETGGVVHVRGPM